MILHILRDIENYGSPNNIDAASNENNLTDFAKRPGRSAHKKREVFVSQVSKRLPETDLIRKANKSLLQSIANKEIDCGPGVAKMDTDGYEDNEGASDDMMQAEAVSSFFTQRFI